MQTMSTMSVAVVYTAGPHAEPNQATERLRSQSPI